MDAINTEWKKNFFGHNEDITHSYRAFEGNDPPFFKPTYYYHVQDFHSEQSYVTEVQTECFSSTDQEGYHIRQK